MIIHQGIMAVNLKASDVHAMNLGVGFKAEFFEFFEWILNWMKQIFIFAIQNLFASFIIFRAILSPFSDSLKTIVCPRNFLILSDLKAPKPFNTTRNRTLRQYWVLYKSYMIRVKHWGMDLLLKIAITPFILRHVVRVYIEPIHSK